MWETDVKAGISPRFCFNERATLLWACEHCVHQLGCNALCFETFVYQKKCERLAFTLHVRSTKISVDNQYNSGTCKQVYVLNAQRARLLCGKTTFCQSTNVTSTEVVFKTFAILSLNSSLMNSFSVAGKYDIKRTFDKSPCQWTNHKRDLIWPGLTISQE